jgi:uncharacterized protein with von Willebrand factor type A (vWA) domain
VNPQTQEHGHRGDAFVRKLVTFGRILREAGLEVGPGRMQDALLGLAAVDLANRDDVYWALRCTIVSRRDDIEVFDAAFAAFWERAPRITLQQRPIELSAELPEESQTDDDTPDVAEAQAVGREVRDGEDPDEQAGDEEKEETAAAVWSADEQLRDRDFARYGPDELRRARALVARVVRISPKRRSLRKQPANAGRTFDPRRTLREAMRTGGVPIERAWREPKLVPRKLVYLVDVSGSMEPYARAMVMFLQAAVRAGRHVEAFTFGTRLTRLTPHLAGRDPDRALANAARAVPDWAGGTRIGENLKAFNDVWGRRGTTRGAIVVIASDGWERGDPTLLAQEMRRLHLAAHRNVWTNPLAGGEGYRPLVAGMQAALPYVDDFLPGHNLRALEPLAHVLEEIGEGSGSQGRGTLHRSA